MNKKKNVSLKQLQKQVKVVEQFADQAKALLLQAVEKKDQAALDEISLIIHKAITAGFQMGGIQKLPCILYQNGFILDALYLDNALITTLPRDSVVWSNIVLRYMRGSVDLLKKDENPLPYLVSIGSYLRRCGLSPETKPLVARCFLQVARQATDPHRLYMEEIAYILYKDDKKKQARIARRLGYDTIKWGKTEGYAYKYYGQSLSSVVSERRELRDAMKTKEQSGLVCSAHEKRRENLLLDIQKKAGEDLMKRLATDSTVHSEHTAVLLAGDVSRDIPILRKQFNQMMKTIPEYKSRRLKLAWT